MLSTALRAVAEGCLEVEPHNKSRAMIDKGIGAEHGFELCVF